MAINYCVNCGEKLEPGTTQCSACGEAVPQQVETEKTKEAEGPAPQDSRKQAETKADNTEDKTTTEEEDFSSFADFTGFDILASDPGAAPAERIIAPPDRTDVMAPVGGMRNASEYRAPQEEKSYLGKALKAAIGLAAVFLVAAGVGLLTQPATQQSIQEQLEAANTRMNSSEDVSDASSEDAETAAQLEAEAADSSGVTSSLAVTDSLANLDEDTAFEYLTQVYDGLQSYNERVYSCIQTYNGTVFSSDKSQREAAAAIANALSNEIDSDIKLLDSMNIGRASALYDDYENVRHLLDDQYQRLGEIVESWEISLGYDTPYEHESEILEPIRRNTGASGVSIYLEDFDANYWSGRPTR